MYKKGDKVTYQGTEQGIVKRDQINSTFVFVVFHCNDDWEDFENYTAQSTPVEYLTKGWVIYE